MKEQQNTRVFNAGNVMTCVLFMSAFVIFAISHFRGAGGRLNWAASTFSQAGAISDIIPQIPGSPLHLFLSKVITRMLAVYELPPYLYATSLSFLFAAITVSIVFVFSCRFYRSLTIKDLIWPLALSIFLTSMPIFWLHATETTIFSLYTALLAIVWMLLTKHRNEDDLLHLILAIIFTSLAVANHISALFLFFAIVGYILVGHKYLLKKSQWLIVTFGSLLILGFMPYSYYDYNGLIQEIRSSSVFFKYFLDGDTQLLLIGLKYFLKPLWIIPTFITVILLVLGLWSLLHNKIYDLFTFIVINVLGFIFYAFFSSPENFLSYLAPIAFMAVVCTAWVLISHNLFIRMLARCILIIGICLNAFFVYSSIPLKSAIDKTAIAMHVHDSMKTSERILMEPSQDNKALAAYYEAVTDVPLQAIWTDQVEESSGTVVAVSYLSPEINIIPNIYLYPEKPRKMQGCCGLSEPIFISRLLVSEYTYQSGDIIKFHQGSRGTRFLSEGFTIPESWGVWSDGPRASLAIPLATSGEKALPSDRPIKLLLMMGAFANPENPSVDVKLRANNVQVAEWNFTYDTQNINGTITEKVIYLPSGLLNTGVLNLIFDINGTTSPLSLGLSPDPRELGIEITQLKMVPAQYIYQSGDTLTFHSDGNGVRFLSEGFMKPERWGVWSDGPRASLTIPLATSGEKALPSDRPIRLLLTMGAFARPENPEVHVKLRANNIKVAEWNFTYNSPSVNNRGTLIKRIVYLPEGMSTTGIINLVFEIDGIASPINLGLGQDTRELGIEITELQMVPGDPNLYKTLKKVGPDPIPETIKKSGLAIEVKDIFKAPRTSNEPPYALLNMLTHANDRSGRLFVNDMRGLIYVFKEDQTESKIFLNLHSIFGGALLGYEFESFTFHPDFSEQGKPGFGRIYTIHGEFTGSRFTGSTPYFKSPIEEDHHQDVIMEWKIDPNNLDRIDPNSGRELMRIGQVHEEHNTADLDFNPNVDPADPDYGKLYISFGDGGLGPNEFADPYDSAQNPSTILGTIIRINPLPKDNKPYQIPNDNPFIGRKEFLPEVWAYGFRNPLNISWDTDTAGNKTMYVTDIGHNHIEEINIIQKGGNYGWADLEGPFVLDRKYNSQLYYVPKKLNKEYISPIAIYDHSEGFAVVGGYVYRGNRIPELFGKYIFGDIKIGRIFYIDVDTPRLKDTFARVQELTLMQNGKPVTLFDLVKTNTDRVDLRFGQDEDGEIYILTKQDGMVRKIVNTRKEEKVDTRKEEKRYSKKYNFTKQDWVTPHIPVWKKVLSNFEGKPNIDYLEIGVYEGSSLLWVLENILTHPTSTATGIEPSAKGNLLTNLKMSGLKHKVEIIEGYSQIELKNLPSSSFDIIYIDGDHHSAAVLTDAILSWPLLKTGGILIFDDYGHLCKDVEYCSPDDKPKEAIDNFVSRYSNYVEIIHVGWQFIIRKKDRFYWEKDKLF